jgi:hypothetical protein
VVLTVKEKHEYGAVEGQVARAGGQGYRVSARGCCGLRHEEERAAKAPSMTHMYQRNGYEASFNEVSCSCF